MKKAMLSPLCSALVIPGLGQVINEQLKKGFCMLAIVFVFILALTFELYQLTSAVLKSGLPNVRGPETLMDRIMAQDLTTLVLIVAACYVLGTHFSCFGFNQGLSGQTPLARQDPQEGSKENAIYWWT